MTLLALFVVALLFFVSYFSFFFYTHTLFISVLSVSCLPLPFFGKLVRPLIDCRCRCGLGLPWMATPGSGVRSLHCGLNLCALSSYFVSLSSPPWPNRTPSLLYIWLRLGLGSLIFTLNLALIDVLEFDSYEKLVGAAVHWTCQLHWSSEGGFLSTNRQLRWENIQNRTIFLKYYLQIVIYYGFALIFQ